MHVTIGICNIRCGKEKRMRKLSVVPLIWMVTVWKFIAIAIHVWTTVIAYGWTESAFLTGLTFIFIGAAEVAWIIILWFKTGTLFTPYAIVIFIFIAGIILLSVWSNIVEAVEAAEDSDLIERE
jgi:hypothetical protein